MDSGVEDDDELAAMLSFGLIFLHGCCRRCFLLLLVVSDAFFLSVFRVEMEVFTLLFGLLKIQEREQSTVPVAL